MRLGVIMPISGNRRGVIAVRAPEAFGPPVPRDQFKALGVVHKDGNFTNTGGAIGALQDPLWE